MPQPIIFYVNGEALEFPVQEIRITAQGRPVAESEALYDGMELRVDGYKQMPILSEILPYVQFPEGERSGSLLTLIVNGQPAEFTTVLHPGDRLTVAWRNNA